MAGSLFSRTWARILLVLVLLTTLVLVGTPFLLQKLFKDWLLENGGDQVTVEDIDFNPFLARLNLEGIEVQVNDERTLAYDNASLDLGWMPLLEKRVVVESVTLRGLRMRVDNSDDLLLILGGIHINKGTGEEPDPASETAPSEWAASVEILRLEDIDLTYRDRDFDITTRIDRLQLSDLTQWTPNRPALLSIDGTVNEAPLKVEAELLPYAQQPAYKGRIELEGFALDVLSSYVKDSFSEFTGALTLTADFDVLQDGQRLKISHAGQARVEDLALTNPGNRVTEKGIEWNGRGTTRVDLDSAALASDIKGKLGSGGLHIENREPPVEITYDQLEWHGSLAIDTGEDPLQLEVRSDTRVEGLDFTARTRKLRLGSADSLELKGVVVQGTGNVAIDQVRIAELSVGQQVLDTEAGESQPAVAHTRLLLIDRIDYADNMLSIDTIDEQHIVSKVVRGKDGKLNMVRIMDLVEHLNEEPAGDGETEGQPEAEETAETETQQEADTPEESEPAEGKPLQIAIGTIKATDDSQIHFLDQSVEPEYTLELVFQNIELNDIDTSQPEQPSELKLEATSGKYTTVKAEARIKPFLETLDIDLTGELRAMDLPGLTPYTHDSLGLDMKSGTLDTDVEVKTDEEVMDGKVVLKLHQFEVESVDVEGSLQSQIPLPLNVALDALRDRNNTIRLEIPVKGDPNNPDINVNDAISQALSKGVSKGAMAYLSYALQPYGAMIAVAKYAGEEIAKVRLKPVEFEAGGVELDAEDLDYLGKVAAILSERPNVSVKLCGVSVKADLDAYRKQQSAAKAAAGSSNKKAAEVQAAAPAGNEPTADEKAYLEDLAGQRAEAVKAHLVETHKSEASRLAGCQPVLELDEADAGPRTDLLI